jgi:DNA-binding NarL/FixJ family response regulator
MVMSVERGPLGATAEGMKMGPLKILLVDDHPGFLEALAYYLSKWPHVRVIAQVASGGEALKRVQAKQPDLVLMDLVMEGMDGFETARRIKTLASPPRVVILTVFNEAGYRDRADEAGLDGFLGKSEITAKLMPLIGTLFPDRKIV